jgi:hypothetical protein
MCQTRLQIHPPTSITSDLTAAPQTTILLNDSKMTNRLRKKLYIRDAMESLQKAFLEEQARQERQEQDQRLKEMRELALQERKMALQGANPVVWPTTMIQPMPRFSRQFIFESSPR